MGEVYRARDTKLNRDVALKILPEAFALDPDRLARFKREAQVLASLNHPNIAAIYGLEDSGETHALVLELVEGPTLADRISKGPIPLDDALPIAKQIAEALEAAHEQGIIHRDLKPANVKVREDGTVKVLDFGLAKLADPTAASGQNVSVTASPTITTPAMMTGVGMILGTAAYMSPEQAKGKPADKRSDIWAFGCVLFEMLTGKHAFGGDDVGDTLASVLKVDPDWAALAPSTPVRIDTLIRRCLVKDRQQRLQAIGEARIVLQLSGDVVSVPVPTRARSGTAGWIAAAILALAVPAAWFLKPTTLEPRQVIRFVSAQPIVPDVSGAIALSRDGSRLAFVSGPRHQIHLRALDQLEDRPIAGTENASWLSFSPDGEWISFVTGERASSSGPNVPPSQQLLKKVAIAGGPVQALAEARFAVGPPIQSWAQDNSILFCSQGVLKRVSSSGGQVEVIAAPDTTKGESYYTGPQLLPDGRTILASIYKGAGTFQHRTIALNPRTGDKKVLLESAGVARYLASSSGSSLGYLVYYEALSHTLMAAPFDAKRLEVKGAAVPVLEGIQGVVGPFGAFAVSDAGTLVYVPGSAAADNERTLVWVDRGGAEQPVAVPARRFNLPRLSPDGDRVAVEIMGSGLQLTDVWVYDVVRGTGYRITHENRNLLPVWMPSGKRLLFASGAAGVSTGVVSAPADGGGPSAVVAAPGDGCFPDSVSPDGKTVIGRGRGGATGDGNSTCLISLPNDASTSKARLIENAPFNRLDTQFSPDGQFVAYQSNESGRYEIYVQSAPGAASDAGRRITISTNGGVAPRWARNTNELFYLSGANMMAVDFQRTPELRAGQPKVLFEGKYSNGYDVAADGKRFLMVKPISAPEARSNQLYLVLNWLEELKQRVPNK
jgi:serine/threonine-protein kinase